MIVGIEIDRDKLRRLGHRKRAVQQAQQATYEAMAREWHGKFLLLHFDESAYGRYRYAARDGQRSNRETKAWLTSYTRRKLRRYGHTRPLVWTGRALGESQLLRLSSTSKWAKVRLSNRFNLRPRSGTTVMRDEVTRILPSESAHLRRVGAIAMKAKLKELKQS